ncbi:MAG: phospholipase D family protein [Alphaproteobacteria bacterium]|nr:phospholipase D family protein [Alphaproteobacteria bacterium]
MRTAAWAVTDFLDAAINLCRTETSSTQLRLYFYAVTVAGWRRLRSSILSWSKSSNRSVTAYIGTDHALTDADAIAAMQGDGMEVRLMRHYTGTFHPKVIWFSGGTSITILSGSNNLTEDGLANNIEFASVTKITKADANLLRWHEEIHKASELATPQLLKSYRTEKEKHGEKRAKISQGGTFTWSMRTSGKKKTKSSTSRGPRTAKVSSGEMILEVMPRETSNEGRQIQIPLDAAQRFFGLGGEVGSSIELTLENMATKEQRSLTFTHNKNSTARLTISELEYRSRPCVLVFQKTRKPQKFIFEIVRQAIDPSRFSELLDLCKQKPPKRRWKL